MRKIPLNYKHFIKILLIDDEDFELVNKWKWHVDKLGYAARSKKIKGTRKSEKIYLHRLIMGMKKGQSVDHINGNKLDNRKENLRVCTQQQNTFNRKKSKSNTSGYKGVFEMKGSRKKKWMAQIMINRKSVFLGYFTDPSKAAYIYDEAAKFWFGPWARTNF